MKLLGLPGIKPATGPWLQSLMDCVELKQVETRVQHYQIWNRPDAAFSLDHEAAIAAAFNPDIIIAKSIGTRVALYARRLHSLQTARWILIGLPLRTYGDEDLQALNGLTASTSTLIIQQTHDPAGSFADLSALVTATANCTLAEVPGNDHGYGDIALLKKVIENWRPATTE